MEQFLKSLEELKAHHADVLSELEYETPGAVGFRFKRKATMEQKIEFSKDLSMLLGLEVSREPGRPQGLKRCIECNWYSKMRCMKHSPAKRLKQKVRRSRRVLPCWVPRG